MGLIRRSLNIASVGVVRSRSRKQRVAAAQLAEMRTQTSLLTEQSHAARAEREGFHSSHPTGSLGYILDARRHRRELAAEMAAPAELHHPAAGWYPVPGGQAEWDGERWTGAFRPFDH